MSRRAALTLAAVLAGAGPVFAFDFEGFRTGMSRADVLRAAGSQQAQTVPGPNGSTVMLSRPYSFELCADKLIGVSKVIDRVTWLADYRTYTGRFGDAAIEAVAGQSVRTVYFMWRDAGDKIVLGLNIDIRTEAADDLGYAINLRDARPCSAAP